MFSKKEIFSKKNFIENMYKYAEDETRDILNAEKEQSDRALSIITTCWFDGLLEKLIRASYISDPKVNSLFKDEHILQTYFAKVNVAYFSGLIPKFLYHDLRLMGEIRNRFAHDVTAALDFSNERIMKRINQFILKPKQLQEFDTPRMNYSLTSIQLGTLLIASRCILLESGLPKFINLYDLGQGTWTALTANELRKIEVNHKTTPK